MKARSLVSLVVLTKLLAQEMSERKRGKILNVASTAAFQPGPFMRFTTAHHLIKVTTFVTDIAATFLFLFRFVNYHLASSDFG